MTGVTAPARLTRASAALSPALPPVRIVHLGLGAFHRAHQAWYTAHATDAADWGIAAFTGQSRELVSRLASQDGLYTLTERGGHGDRSEIVSSIVRVATGDDVAAFAELLADPRVVILTLTITERGYRISPQGRLDTDDPGVRDDIVRLRAGDAAPRTALGKVLVGLDARRRAGGPTLTIVPCDNLPDNGRVVGDALHDLAEIAMPEVAAWMERGISVVSTSVDRITPQVTSAELDSLRVATGWADAAPVITEPFSDWILSGEFPEGHPDWESAGARFVADIEPWENRKLWMLNGAHTLLALWGELRGHTDVAQAIEDPVLRTAVQRLWDEDARHLPGLDVAAYRSALVARFRNRRIEHRLEQIAKDSATKLRVRIVPVALRERAAGRPASACAAVIAAWLASIEQGRTERPVLSSGSAPTRAELVSFIDPQLGGDDLFCAEVVRALSSLLSDISPNEMDDR